nr:hypothetical protein [Tanacetum cinerariifolium]
MEDLKQQYLDEMKRLSNSEYRDEIKIVELKENFNDDDDDDEDYTIAVTTSVPIEEPDNSLSMGDEHLDTILATESDEFIKSSVENLIPIPSESEGIPDHMCDVPFHDNSPPLDVSNDQFEDFSDYNDEFSSIDDDSFSIDKIDYVEASPPDSELVSSEVMEIIIPEVGGIDDDIRLTINDDILRETLLNVNHLFAKIEALNDNPTLFFDPIVSGTPPTLTPFGESDFFSEESCSDEDVPEKIFSTPLFDEEIIPMKIDQHHDNVESDLMESLRTHDSSLIISFKIDSLLDEFAGELTLLKSIPSEIDETGCDFEEDIRLIEKLFDSLMEEIDLTFTPDYPMPPGIEDDDYDSEMDILILKDLPSNDTLSFPEKESFHFDIPSFSRPPAKPPDAQVWGN